MNVFQAVAQAIGVRSQQVEATARLLDEGSTLPFIARYRKEATGGLDDQQLRDLVDHLQRIRDLEQRRSSILSSMSDGGHLTDTLRDAIMRAGTRTELEDLYLPFKPKRQTRAQKALQAGLGPLESDLWHGKQTEPNAYVCELFADEAAVLKGARDIAAERLSEQAQLRQWTRQRLSSEGVLTSRARQLAPDSRFADYAEHQEPFAKTPPHRAMAMFRGRDAGELSLSIELPDVPESDILSSLARLIDWPNSEFAQTALRWAWRTKLKPAMESECLAQLWQRAEDGALDVFQKNLTALLMAPPAGTRPTLGLDPGLRTGCKGTVVDETGTLIAHATWFPLAPQNKSREFQSQLVQWVKQHGIQLIAVGNGTGGRETLDLVQQAVAGLPDVTAVSVSESGASVYSASVVASQEFPDLDVSYRGAVSIARRLQDPLAELVKIDPKALGIGQYQHDVNQTRLADRLEQVIEQCVNQVGVDLNTASPALLQAVAGIGPSLAQAIVATRSQQGRFNTRHQLMSVKGMGAKTFEQCAGFLRIRNGDEPLDASAVHPEAYPLAQTLIQATGRALSALQQQPKALDDLNLSKFISDQFGLPTLKDLITELKKPGRDPRGDFVTAQFDADVRSPKDLEAGMKLQGVVTNVTDFGAFVDIGVKQDGLVHISQLADRFIKHPSEAVKTGDVITVWVMDVDLQRNRISLRAKSSDTGARSGNKSQNGQENQRARRPSPPSKQSQPGSGSLGTLAAAFAKANKK